MNCAWPNTVLNTAVADQLDRMATTLEMAIGQSTTGETVEGAVCAVLQAALRKHERVIFDGNSYASAWHEEAKQRGLPNNCDTPAALLAFNEKGVENLFSRHGVMCPEELSARVVVLAENYATQIGIDADSMIGRFHDLGPAHQHAHDRSQ